MRVETSSGLIANVSKMTGEPMREIRRNKNNKKFHAMTYALQQCVEVVSPGIYKDVKEFDELLTGDRVLLYHKIREATKGTKFNFDLRCPVQGCNEKISWKLDLEEDIDILELPEDRKKALATKNVFTEQLDGYGEVKVKYTNGHDEVKQIADTIKYDDMTAMIFGQIISVGNHSGEHAVLQLLNKEGTDLEDKLLQICQKYEFGPVTVIEVVCRNPMCGAVSTVRLPMDIRFFYDAIGKIS